MARRSCGKYKARHHDRSGADAEGYRVKYSYAFATGKQLRHEHGDGG